jgi:hypothetical protein
MGTQCIWNRRSEPFLLSEKSIWINLQRMFVLAQSSQAQENSCINLMTRASWEICSYAGIVLTNMSRRGLLSIDDTIYKSQPLLISGAAKSYLRLKVRDSIPVDSLSVNEEFEKVKSLSKNKSPIHITRYRAFLIIIRIRFITAPDQEL